MRYDESHNILNKAQNHLRGSADPNDTSLFLNNISEAMEDTAYNLDYEDYASGSFTAGGHSYVQPHAPRTIVEYPFGAGADEPSAKRKLLDYDANGNLLLVEQEISDPEDPMGKAKISLRENLWDEEDRLRAVDLKPEAPSNKPEVAAYTYDASGERSIKYLPGRLDAYYSAKAAGSADRLESILYPSPLLTVKTRPLPEHMEPDELSRTSITKYTKHYYIGTERIASALGTMRNLGLLCENVWPGSQDIIDEMGTKTVAAGDVLIADYDAFEKELQLPEPYLYETYICNQLEHEPINYDAYWYHPDHLGSSSYITNLAGEVSQHMEYLPFGETLVEEHLNSYNSPYKFNAKEFDAETGWYYYGARYYSPKYNLMVGVDPMYDKYPSFSPYAYTLQNPVRYTDPTGMTANDWVLKSDNTLVYDSRVTDQASAETYYGEESTHVAPGQTVTTVSGNKIQLGEGGYWYSNGQVNRASDQAPVVYANKLDGSDGVTAASAFTAAAKEIQYSKFFQTWRGKNGKINKGLSGRGPNQHTGSRGYAKGKAGKIGFGGAAFGGLSIIMTEINYSNSLDIPYGPNMRRHLSQTRNWDQTANGTGFLGVIGAAASFGYNAGYLIEGLCNCNIQLNPYTGDFTPIERTLQQADYLGIDLNQN